MQCLQLYYRDGRSQKDIAVALGVSAATVSRLLKRAFDDGLVRVELDLPRTQELETALITQFGLRDAVVIASGGRGDAKDALGAAAAAYFEKVARDGMRVGLSCGFTLYQTIRQLRERRFRDLELYPLSGESTLKLVDLFPNTLVGMMAAKYRPHVRAYALPVQHLISLRDIERERRRLLRDPEVRRIYELAQDIDIALVGIGLIGDGTPGFCSLAESYGVSVRRLRQLGVVGEINYQPFDTQRRGGRPARAARPHATPPVRGGQSAAGALASRGPLRGGRGGGPAEAGSRPRSPARPLHERPDHRRGLRRSADDSSKTPIRLNRS